MSGSHPVAAVQLYVQSVLWLTLGQGRKLLLFLLEGGVASPLPPTAELPLLMQAGRRGVENGLICLVTSVLGS